MNRAKAVIISAAVSGLFITVINIVFFATMKDVYTSNLSCLIAAQQPVSFGLKIAGASFISAFIIALGYDLSYSALPGGVFRKTLNFGTMIFLVSCGIWLPLLYAVTAAGAKFYIAMLVQCIIISFAASAVMSGVYYEYSARSKADALEIKNKENDDEEDSSDN